MATDKFVGGDLVLVDSPDWGYWPCQVSRIISKNWRQVEYFGGGDEIGEAHMQVIRDYDEATKDDLEVFIPKKKMDKDAALKQAVKQINQKLAGKKTRTSGVKRTSRSDSKRMVGENNETQATNIEAGVSAPVAPVAPIEINIDMKLQIKIGAETFGQIADKCMNLLIAAASCQLSDKSPKK